ncbi:MAG: VPLPA-CTERM-specific exosortase XrtD [Gammaproteobacteria bacterium]|nr:VPLPA-CTERM-specific exosortase XrtD [Gammaproteobacteria bacterium]
MQDKTYWKTGSLFWGVLVVGGLLLSWAAYPSLLNMVRRWDSSEEYGYGYMIPFITLFLIWQRKDKLASVEFKGSWGGVLLLLLGSLVLFVGQISTLHSITQYGYLIALIGGAYALLGREALKIIFMPLLLLFLMVPLPAFLFNNLSSQLQLISSEIGVAVIRMFGLSVYLEGNVIDLGTYKLQVVEACSGLRYLFPLVSLSIIAAYFYKDAIWKRVVLILSSIPITVLMNSFRIGVIGVLVEYGGPEQAEGFLHDFEGWVVFMGCVAVLVGEMWLLTRLGGDRRPFSEIFGVEFPVNVPMAGARSRPVSIQAIVMVLILAGTTGAAALVAGRQEIVPERTSFDAFPRTVDGWVGYPEVLEDIVLDALKLDDYVLADYRNADGKTVNFYAAYYASQRSGAAAHSPASCLPGGGWRMNDLTLYEMLPGLVVNRSVIQKGEYRQLVYYWFKQRDRIVANEFMVKWYLLWDALTRNRTDGALVRLTTSLSPGEDVKDADARMTAFAATVVPGLNAYIPD